MKIKITSIHGKKIIKTVLKILGGLAVCLLIPLGLKSFLIKPILRLFSLNLYVSKSIQFTVMLGIILATYLLYFRKTEKREIKEIRFFPKFKQSLLGFLIGALIISIVMVLLSVSGMNELRWKGISDTVIYGFLYIFVLAASEEIFFRGVIFRILEEDFGLKPALLISTILFAIPHAFNPNATAIMILSVAIGGVAMGLLFSFSKNLWVPMFSHAGWNFAQAVFGLNVSGINKFSEFGIFKSSLKGPDILTGGKTGPENSIIALVLLTYVVFYIYRLYIKKTSVSPKS
jgi:membrane protease YdiL (CAAX protease family)